MSGNSDPRHTGEIKPDADPASSPTRPAKVTSELDREKRKVLAEAINDILKGIPFVGPYIVIVKLKWGWTGILLLIGGFLLAVVFAFVGLLPEQLIATRYKTNAAAEGKRYEVKPYDEVPWKSVIGQAKHKVLASGVALTNIDARDLVNKVANEKVQATIVMVDPCGEAVQRRQQDEGSRSASANVFGQLKGFGRHTSDPRLSDEAKRRLKNSLEVWLIEGYPTMVVVIVDDDLYAYFCIYGTPCSKSPVLIFRNYQGNPDGEYFASQFRAIFDSNIRERVKLLPNYDQHNCPDQSGG